MDWLVVTLVPWVYAAYTDHKHRMAPNLVWVSLLALGIGATVLTARAVTPIVLTVLVLAPVSYYLYNSGEIAGADSKALYVLPVVYGTLSFPMLILTACFAIPWLRYRESDYAVPLLVPLSGAVVVVVAATVLF